MSDRDGFGSLFSPEAVIIFPVAALFDVLTILCTILVAFFGVGILLGIGIDIIAIIIFSIWMLSRSGEISQGVEEKATNVLKREKAKESAQGKAAQKTKKIGKKVTQKILRKKITRRLLIAFIGSLIPILQLIPFWTIMTYKELKSH